MPEICRFFGIIIRMYFDDHNPPHFHAIYENSEALVGIDPIIVIEGNLSQTRRFNDIGMGGTASKRIN